MSAAKLLATWFGAGLSPKAPGTVGTLATVPLYALLCVLPGTSWTVAVAALLVATVGTWATSRYLTTSGLKDPQEVVVDESSGYLIACCGGVPGLTTGLLAFVLFRLFDITKPWPVSRLERLPGAWGVMADDWMAGVLAALVIAAATLLLPGGLPELLS
ncbi:MAG: phosphatidylglycerophosphatase A [Acidobacteriota bacterium]